LIIIANPTPSNKYSFLSFFEKIVILPCHPFAKINAVAGPRLENCPRANSR